MIGGKNTLSKASIRTWAWKGGTLAIHAVAEIEDQSPGMNSKPRKFKIYSSGSKDVSLKSTPEFIKQVEQDQLDELKHYLSLLNVDLSNFDEVFRW